MTQAFLFFPFQLALPKTSVLLLCQRNSRFLTFFILFFALCLFPFAFGTFRPLPFEILPVVFLFSVVSFAVFLGESSLFAMSVCFNSDFLTFFILLFAPLPLSFAFGTFRPLPFEILPVVFLFYVVSFAVFLGQYSLFFNVCVFQQRFSCLFYIVFCL